MKFLTFLLLALLWSFEKPEAAEPYNYTAHASFLGSSPHRISQPAPPETTLRKPSALQKHQQKLERKLKKLVSRSHADDTGTGGVLSTIALALGIACIGVLFIPSIAGISFLLAIGALITGIIALARKNKAKSVKAKAIVAVVLGGLIIVGLVLLIAAWGGLFGSIE